MRVNNLVNIPVLKAKTEDAKKEITFTGLTNPKELAKPSTDLLKMYFTGSKPIWSAADAKKREQITQFAEEYKTFLNASKTDLQTVVTMVNRAKEKGFQPWPEDMPKELIKPGDKFYRINRDRSVSLIVMGNKPLTEGFKMAGSHIDSPHIMLKAQPLQDAAGGFAIFKTMIHGGIKNHQWTQRNLALVGTVIKTNGEKINIDIGNKPNDPVFLIPELAIHVDRNHNSTPSSEQFPKEKMDPIVGLNLPDDETAKKVSDQVENILKEQYGITREDLLNSQLALVPAQMARDVGFDRSMISGYGHDDKSSAYCSMEALLEASEKSTPARTIIATAFSNEEIGSYNNHGAQSDDTRAIIAEAIEYSTGNYQENLVRKAFKNSVLLSADVSTAIDPMKPDAEEATNSAKLGYGPSVYKNGALFSTPEASAKFDSTQKGVQTQRFAFNQDKGGGGTIGNYLATQQNTDVVDTGIPVIGMHAPLELISKSDLFEHKESLKNYYVREMAF